MQKRLLVPAFLSSALLFCCALPAVAQQGDGYLKVKVNTGRAGVFIDGKYVGPAANFRIARKYAVPAGEHEVKLDEPRFEAATTKVQIVAGKTTVVKETLKELPLAKPPFGRLRVETADKYSAVFVEGKFMGHAGEFNNPVQGLLLNPGDYTVKVVPVSGPEHEEKIKIDADKVTIIKVKS
ncbi:MAG TPA: PEGA domain-containing protein [Bryobacteraceae bacterium]|jgi:PEGA domain|nr:PEGA domain-containing protein [Bryobacteraceae bacterium]